jgi:hypothetical protein
MGLTSEMEETNPRFTAALHGVYTGLIAFIERIIEGGQARGEIRSDVEPRLLALNIVGLLRGVSCFGVLNDMGLDCAVVIDAFQPVLAAGLRPAGRAAR